VPFASALTLGIGFPQTASETVATLHEANQRAPDLIMREGRANQRPYSTAQESAGTAAELGPVPLRVEDAVNQSAAGLDTRVLVALGSQYAARKQAYVLLVHTETEGVPHLGSLRPVHQAGAHFQV